MDTMTNEIIFPTVCGSPTVLRFFVSKDSKLSVGIITPSFENELMLGKAGEVIITKTTKYHSWKNNRYSIATSSLGEEISEWFLEPLKKCEKNVTWTIEGYTIGDIIRTDSSIIPNDKYRFTMMKKCEYIEIFLLNSRNHEIPIKSFVP